MRIPSCVRDRINYMIAYFSGDHFTVATSRCASAPALAAISRERPNTQPGYSEETNRALNQMHAYYTVPAEKATTALVCRGFNPVHLPLFEKHFLLGCLRRAPEIGAAKHFRTGLEGFLGTITPEDVIFLSEWGSDSLHLILFQILERFRFDGKQILLNIASQGRKHSWQAYDLLMKDKLTISDIGRLLGCGNRLIYSDILSLPQASPERDRIKEALSRSYTEEVLAAEARSISRSTPMSLEVVDQLPSWNLFCKYPGAFSRLHRTHQEYWDSDILGALQYLRRYFTDDQGKICAALGKINPVLFDALKPWISYCYSPRESDDPEIKRAINIAMDSSKP